MATVDTARARAEATREVKGLALEHGFDLVGVARAERLPADALEGWLARGFHGSMAYMAEGREARLDPSALLPGVRSVVALAVDYFHPGDTVLPGGGRISRYAWGRDYHKVVGARLNALRRAVRERFPGVRDFGGVDAVPIMEKVWAERAGLGWIGKNGNLLTTRFGSWVFLACLLLDMELDPDAPHADRCGSCTACLSACPTGAIVSPGVVDARRCLSYHSIEHRDPWPEEIAERGAGWMYGCDACQDPCPWSAKFAVPSEVGDLAPRERVMSRPLAEWVGLDEAGWDEATRGSAMRRPGHAGLVRDALAAAVSVEGDAALDRAVEARAGDPDDAVREQARRAIAARARRHR